MARASMATPRTKWSQLSALLTGTKLARVMANDEAVEPEYEVDDPAVEQVVLGLGVSVGLEDPSGIGQMALPIHIQLSTRRLNAP